MHSYVCLHSYIHMLHIVTFGNHLLWNNEANVCHLQGSLTVFPTLFQAFDLKCALLQNFLFTTRNEDAPMKIIDFGLSDFIWPGNICLFINLHLYLVYEQ